MRIHSMQRRCALEIVLCEFLCILLSSCGDSTNSGLSSIPDAHKASSIVNGGFEDWEGSIPRGWSVVIGAWEGIAGETSAISQSSDDPIEGGFTARLEGTDSTRLWYSLQQGPFPNDTSVTWDLSGWMRTINVRENGHRFHNCQIFAVAFDENGNRVGMWSAGKASGTTVWNKHSVRFNLPDSAHSFNVGVFLSMSGAADFDSISLVQIRGNSPDVTEPYQPQSSGPPGIGIDESSGNSSGERYSQAEELFLGGDRMNSLRVIEGIISDASRTGDADPNIIKLKDYVLYFDSRAESGPITIHYNARILSNRQVNRLLDGYSRAMDRIQKVFSIESDSQIRLYVYDPNAAAETFNVKFPCSYVRQRVIETFPNASFGHELTHVITYEIGSPDYEFVQEGVCDAMVGWREGRPLSHWAAYYYRNGLLPPLYRMVIGLDPIPEPRNWVSGAFFSWLREARGDTALREFYRTADPARLGTSWEEMDRSWKKSLTSISISDTDMDIMENVIREEPPVRLVLEQH